jgi:hypothetical protein
VVPLGIDSEKGGEVTFSAFTIPLNSGTFFLEDRTLGTFTDLSKDTYTVNLPAKTAGTGRFFIQSSPSTLVYYAPLRGGQGGAFRIWNVNNRVNIEGAVSNKATGAIYDLLGRKIYEARLNDSNLNTFTVPTAVRGIYLVKVSDGMKTFTQKVVF